MNWFVLCVKSRSEKKVAQRLESKGVAIFFPTKIEERAWSDRIKKVEVPFFTSYIFAKFTEKEAVNILNKSYSFVFAHPKQFLYKDEDTKKIELKQNNILIK